ncbi:hypothetical protein lbkm_0698 [Lachnospiraceae bacterium KM106-2]|nr:hypothetical protein lbkm_0698 [Lachnospiraceae bacterium KM106-2]
MYEKTIVTDKGKSLINKLLNTTNKIIFSKLETGDGTYDTGTEFEKLSNLKSKKQEFLISSAVIEADKVRLRTVITNKDLSEGYTIKEIGLYATDPDDGDILFSITIAKDDEKDVLPAYDGNYEVTVTLDSYVLIDTLKKCIPTIVTGAYASVEDLTEHIDNNDVHITKVEREKWNKIANKNLLVNGDFQVWQRGNLFKNASFGSYCADRWTTGASIENCNVLEAEANVGGAKVEWPADTTGAINLCYRMTEREKNKIIGKNVTITLRVNYLTISKTITIPDGSFYIYCGVTMNSSFSMETSIILKKDDNISSFDSRAVYIDISNSGSHGALTYATVKFVKLEYGDHYSGFEPRDYHDELRDCSLYYQKHYFRFRELVSTNGKLWTRPFTIPLLGNKTHEIKVVEFIDEDSGGTLTGSLNIYLDQESTTNSVALLFMNASSSAYLTEAHQYRAVFAIDASIY